MKHPLTPPRKPTPVITFESSADFDSHEWCMDDLSRGTQPWLYSVDNSYSDAFGVVFVFGVECSDTEHLRAVEYSLPASHVDVVPAPPMSLVTDVTWWNAPKADEDHQPSLPLRVDLTLHADLHECHATLRAGRWVVSAVYACHYEVV